MLKNFIAKIFGIKTSVVIQTILDREISQQEYGYIADFLATKAGEQFCNFLMAQKYAVADKAAQMPVKGDFWQGYVRGYKSAIEQILQFRRSPDANGETSNSSKAVGLEDFASNPD